MTGQRMQPGNRQPTGMPAAGPGANRSVVIASVMAVLAMISIEATIVSTAMPFIANRLGGFQLYSWVFSAYLLTQTASTLVFGKLADLYGRRAVLLIGIAIFLAGSLMCGTAWSMPSLIAFRLVQGLGAGAVLPVAITVVGDLYPLDQRGRIQAWISAVWGVSSVVGPIIGAFIVAQVSWVWVFWMNIPIALAAAAGFNFFMREASAERERRVDVVGAAILATTVAALMMGMNMPGGDRRTTLAAAAVFVVGFALLVWQERRARDPIIDFGLWLNRSVAATNLVTLFCSMAIIGLTTFLPMYAQVVMGQSPLVAGFMLTSMLFGWPVSSMVAARNFTRFGLKPMIVCGAALLTLGSLFFILLSPTSSPFLGGTGSLIMGVGMGLVGVTGIVLVQEHVAWHARGAATASSIFSRNLGSTLGAAMLGAVLNISLQQNGITSLENMHDLVGHGSGPLRSSAERLALIHSLHMTFCGLSLIAATALVLSAFIPASTPKRVED